MRPRIDPSEPEKIEYRVGTKALEMSFVKNFPPDQVKEGREFQAIVEVKNQGAYDINDLKLSLKGIIKQFTEVVGDSQITIASLPGKSLNYPEGSKEIISFKIKNNKRSTKDIHTELIKIDACYRYQTKANADICIDPTSYLTVQKEQLVCQQDQTISLSGGQGAPIAITKIEQTTTPVAIEEGRYELELKFYISNLGRGIVFLNEDCEDGGIIKIEDVTFHNYQLGSQIDCGFERGNNTLVLDQRNNILTCTADIYSTMGSFPTPLTITLDYWYEDSVDETVEILKTK
ncbi:hypothetical protein KY331_00250 [Candidatus Woesearchaeota archaeon]|nr:hypothetical protein [Candidatus Woesearchaeota archaeon]